MELQAKRRRLFVTAGLCVTALLLMYPVKTLSSRYFHSRAVSIMKAGPVADGSTEYGEMTLRRYQDAIQSLERASALDPSRPDYRKAQADLHLRLANWMRILESMGEVLPSGAPTSAAVFQKAEAAFNEAIRLEPMNADHHFALAVLQDAVDSLSGRSEKELERAIKAYPVNASLRYAVAVQHLTHGRPGQALEQATVLAKLAGAAESGPARSQLFSAFEIAWRATKDMQVLQGLCPDQPKALLVLDEYMRRKGSGKN
jgi:tetratricopeptide (TPR) repeat protein